MATLLHVECVLEAGFSGPRRVFPDRNGYNQRAFRVLNFPDRHDCNESAFWVLRFRTDYNYYYTTTTTAIRLLLLFLAPTAIIIFSHTHRL